MYLAICTLDLKEQFIWLSQLAMTSSVAISDQHHACCQGYEIRVAYSSLYVPIFIFIFIFLPFLGQDFRAILKPNEYGQTVSRIGTKLLVYSGYTYGLHIKNRYRCTKNASKCFARAILNSDGSLELRSYHNHPPTLSSWLDSILAISS